MKRKQIIIAASCLAMLGFTGSAFAATVAPAAALVKNIANESVRTIVTPTAIAVNLGATEALSINDSVTFTLGGGATFAAVASGDLTAVPNVAGAAFALAAGGTGFNFATYRVTTANTDMGTVLTLAATATHNDSAVAANGAATVTVDMKGFVGGIATSLFGTPLVSGGELMVPSFAASAVTPVVHTVDVTTGFLNFVSGVAPAALSTTASRPAVFTVTPNPADAVNNNTAGVPAAVPASAQTLITIRGAGVTAMAGLLSITEDAAGATVSSATATGGVPVGGTVANNFFIDTANNAAYAIVTTPHVAGAAETYNVTFNYNGTTAQEDASYNVSVDRLAGDVNFAAQAGVLANSPAATFARNGFSVTTTSVATTSASKLFIRDTSGILPVAGAKIRATVTTFNALTGASTTVGPVLLTQTLPNNGEVLLTPASILANPGFAAVPAATRATIKISAETPTATATVNKQTASGVDIGSTGANNSILK